MRGLQVKPIDVRYGASGIYVNGEKLDTASALTLLGRSRELSPVADILVSVDEGSYGSAVRFMRLSATKACATWQNVDTGS